MERIFRAVYKMETGFSTFALRRACLETLNLAMLVVVVRHSPSESTSLDQEIIYYIGIAISVCTLFYYWLLEDCSPFLCLDPIQHFAMGMTMEQYFEKFYDVSSSATFAADVERVLGINTRQELDSVISLMTLRFEARRENVKRMCLASYPMMAMNLVIFITNMTRFCSYNGNNWVLDCSSVLSVVLIGAARSDILTVASDTFMAKFHQTADVYRNNFKTRVTLRTMILKLIVMQRFGFKIPEMHRHGRRKPYSYSTSHYAAKQFVEDVIEDSTNLTVWYEHLLDADDVPMFSDGAVEDRAASADLRLIACLACNWVANEMSVRACPDELSRGETPLSNIILYLASITVQHLSNAAMITGIEMNQAQSRRAVTDEIVKLAILLALQAEFDTADHDDSLPGSLSGLGSASFLLERLSSVLDDWSRTTEHRAKFYKAQLQDGLASPQSTQRSFKSSAARFQILYLSDVDFRDNTSFFEASEVKIRVLELVVRKLGLTEADYDRIQQDLFDKDPHLYTAGGLRTVQLGKARTMDMPSIEAKEALALQMEIENPQSTSARAPESVDVVDCGKCAPANDQNCAPSNNDGCAPSTNQGCSTVDDDRCAPQIKTNSDRQSPFEFLSNSLLSEKRTKVDAAQIAVELQSLQEIKAELLAASGAHRIVAYLRFWAHNSFLIKLLLWINWRETVWALCCSVVYRFAVILLFVPLGIVQAVFLAVDGKLFTSTYWLSLLPRTIRKWSSTQTNSFIVDKFAISLIAGVLCYRFMLCAVHVGEPDTRYNRGGVVAVILAILFSLVYLHVKVTSSSKDSSGQEVFHLLLPASAMALGGFLAVKLSGESLADELYLGLGPAYDLTDKYQALLVPILYGLMHDSLVLFCFLPLTMCRLTLLRICELPCVGGLAARLLGTHNMYGLHRELGYLMLIFILVGAVIWWIAVYHACSYGSVRACRAFYPEGNYFDIRGPPWFCENVPTDHEFYRVWLNYSACVVKSGGNPGAVLFLRQLITFLLTMICITAEFKYPLLSSQTGRAVDEAEKAKQTPSRWLAWVAEAQGKVSAFFSKLYKDVLGPNEFEVFIYTHIFITYAIAVAAFFSRFEVFHAAAVCWGLFFLDKLAIVLLHTHTFRISKESEMYEGAMKLVLKKRHWFPWKSKAGEIAFLHCPRIGPFWLGRQWHAFSLASSNSLSADDTHDQIEFLIQVHAKGSWTHTLSRALFDPKSKLSYHSPIYVHVRGPFGSSFQGYREADVIMLIGGGSGIASSLSVLRELVAFRGNVKKVWFIFATRQFSRYVVLERENTRVY